MMLYPVTSRNKNPPNLCTHHTFSMSPWYIMWIWFQLASDAHHDPHTYISSSQIHSTVDAAFRSAPIFMYPLNLSSSPVTWKRRASVALYYLYVTCCCCGCCSTQCNWSTATFVHTNTDNIMYAQRAERIANDDNFVKFNIAWYTTLRPFSDYFATIENQFEGISNATATAASHSTIWCLPRSLFVFAKEKFLVRFGRSVDCVLCFCVSLLFCIAALLWALSVYRKHFGLILITLSIKIQTHWI